MSRWKAAGIHLIISMLVILTVVCLIYFVWFPYGLFRIAGLDRLFLTMLCVDITVGPALTCLVYKVGKPSLKWDLGIIAFLQAAFLGYALHTAWVSRPVFLVWSIDEMYLVFANEIEAKDLAAGSTAENRSLSWTGPRLVSVVAPKDNDEKTKFFTDLILSQTSLERLPRRYLPYANGREVMLRVSHKLEESPGFDSNRATIEKAIDSTGRDASGIRFVKIESSRDAAIMLIDATTAQPINTVALQLIYPAEKTRDRQSSGER